MSYNRNRNADRERRREEARLERINAVKIQQPPEEYVSNELFSEPVQRTDKKDERIKMVMGDYRHFYKTLTSRNLPEANMIGVTRTPITPSTPLVTPRDEPFPLPHDQYKCARVNGFHHKDRWTDPHVVKDEPALNDIKNIKNDGYNKIHHNIRESGHEPHHRSCDKQNVVSTGSSGSRRHSSDRSGSRERKHSKEHNRSSQDRSRSHERSVSRERSKDSNKNSGTAYDNHSIKKHPAKFINGHSLVVNGSLSEDKPKLSIENAKHALQLADVDNILREMIVKTPLTAILTPQKEESKFSFPAPKEIPVLNFNNRDKPLKPDRSDSSLFTDLACSSSEESDTEGHVTKDKRCNVQNKRYSRSSTNNASSTDSSDSDSGSSSDSESDAASSRPGSPHHSQEEEEEKEKPSQNWNLGKILNTMKDESSSCQTDQCNNVTSTVKESCDVVTSSFPDDVLDDFLINSIPKLEDSSLDILRSSKNQIKLAVPESTVNEALIPQVIDDSDDNEQVTSNINEILGEMVVPKFQQHTAASTDLKSFSENLSPNTAPTSTFKQSHNENDRTVSKVKTESPKKNLVADFRDNNTPVIKNCKQYLNKTPRKDTKKRSKVKSKSTVSSDSDNEDDLSMSNKLVSQSISELCYVPEPIAPLKPDSTDCIYRVSETYRQVQDKKLKTDCAEQMQSNVSLNSGSGCKISSPQPKPRVETTPQHRKNTDRFKAEPDHEMSVALNDVFTSVIGSTQDTLLSPLPYHEHDLNAPPPLTNKVRKIPESGRKSSPGHRKSKPPANQISLDNVFYKTNGKPRLMVHLSLSLLKWIPPVRNLSVRTEEIKDVTIEERVVRDESEPVDNREHPSDVDELEPVVNAAVILNNQLDKAENTCSDMDISDSDPEDGECPDQMIEVLQPFCANSAPEQTISPSSNPPPETKVGTEQQPTSKAVHDQTILTMFGDSTRSLKQIPKIPKRKQVDNIGQEPNKRYCPDRSSPKPIEHSDRDALIRDDDQECDRNRHHHRIKDRRGSTSSNSSHLSNRSDSKHVYDRDRRDSHERDNRERNRERSRGSGTKDHTDHDRPRDDRVFRRVHDRDGIAAEYNGNPGHNWFQSDRETDERMETADHYLIEAKKLKHKADGLVQQRPGQNNKSDKLAKSLMYVEAVLSFIECGIAMEHERISVTSKIFTMFRDTLNLLRYICRFGGSRDPEISSKERKLYILSLRIQSLLCLKLYKLKTAEASKLKKAIDDYNKQPPPPAAKSQAPSPYQNTWNRSTGTPSPMSPTPSPASVASVGSQGSGDCLPRLTTGNLTPVTNSVLVPQRIHSVIQQYIQIMDHLYQCHSIWDQADTGATEFKGFFRALNESRGELTLSSSLQHLVKYVRNGLHHLKDT